MHMHNAALSADDLRRRAPAVFADAKHASRSDRYAYYPTMAIVEAMTAEGWAPVAVTTASVRDASREGFQKHAIRFARTDDLARWQDFTMSHTGYIGRGEASKALARVECLITNSHDGSSAYRIDAGLFRPICSNGLVVSDGDFARISVPHKGNTPEEVVAGSLGVVREIPRLQARVADLAATTWTGEERRAFAEAATMLRFAVDDPGLAPLAPERLLEARRREDVGSDAWTTLNVVQENVIRGGLRGRAPASEGRRGRRFSTRAVEGIDQNTSLNKALWHLATVLRRGDIAPTGTVD